MKPLYPRLEPYEVHFVDVGHDHRIYVEECGDPSGIPVIFLHGGPASGCKPHHRCFFDPKRYRIFLFDQRGCGRSLPHGELAYNTSPDLVSDIEHFRTQFGIDRWLLFGGSWGAALALLYAQKFPDKVCAMILRGTFLARRRDREWFLQDGANRIYPEQWERVIGAFPKSERNDLIGAMENGLWGADELGQLRAAREWDAWGAQVSLGNAYNPSEIEQHITAEIVRRVRIELHYAKNEFFLVENQILDRCKRIEHVPTVIIHGRHDLVCPPEAAYSLNKKLPKSRLLILPNSGHVAAGEEMIDALVDTSDRMAKKLNRL